MVDLGSCAAEFSFILSMAALSHTTAIAWKHCYLASSPASMVLFTIILLYLCARRRLPYCVGRSFNLQYWKYSLYAIIAVGKDYGDIKNLDNVDRVYFFLLWELGLLLATHNERNRPNDDRVDHGGVEPEEGHDEQAGVVTLILRWLLYQESGIGIQGTYSVHINSILVLLIYILSGLVWVSVLELYFGWEFKLIFLSYILQRSQILDLTVQIPVPFDVVCFFLCYYTVGSNTGLEESFASGNASHILYWGFIMSSITAIFFIMYYYCASNA